MTSKSTMTLYSHTYGPSCSLHAESSQYSLRPCESSRDPPKIRAQFFYSSALPIDDPLSRVPPPTSNSATTLSRVPPRPFSVFDNTALEEAWQMIQTASHMEKDQQSHGPALQQPPAEVLRASDSGVDKILKPTDDDEEAKLSGDRRSPRRGQQFSKLARNTSPPATEPSTLAASARAPLAKQQAGDLTLSDDPEHIPFDHAMPVSSEETGNDEFEGGKSRTRRRSPFNRKGTVEKSKTKDSITASRALGPKHNNRSGTAYGSSPTERDTTGTPFLRVASRLKRSRSRSPRSAARELRIAHNDGAGSTSDDEKEQSSQAQPPFMRSWTDQSNTAQSSSHEPLQATNDKNDPTFKPHSESNKVYITVGISRLHVVEMPDLRVSEQHIETGT